MFYNTGPWLNGVDKKIKVEEIGPFVYKEQWTKSNITFHRFVVPSG